MRQRLLMLLAFVFAFVYGIEAQTTYQKIESETIVYATSIDVFPSWSAYSGGANKTPGFKSSQSFVTQDEFVASAKVNMLTVKPATNERFIVYYVTGVSNVYAYGIGPKVGYGLSIEAVADDGSTCPAMSSAVSSVANESVKATYPAIGSLDPSLSYTITVRGVVNDSYLYAVRFTPGSDGPSTDATLSSLTVNDNEVTKMEDGSDYDYEYELLYTYSEPTFTVAATTTNSGAVAAVSPSNTIATPEIGLYTDVQVNVTPASGSEDAKTYVLRVFKQASLSSDASLGMLKVNNNSVTLVDEQLIYNVELPITYATATTTVEIGANDGNASIQPSSSLSVSVPGQAIFTITPQSGTDDAKTYTINVAKATYHAITEGETFETSEANILSTGWAVYTNETYATRSNLGSGNYPNLSKDDRMVDLYVSGCASITIKAEGNTSNDRVLTINFNDGGASKTAFWPGGVTEQTFNVPTTGECKISIGGLDNKSVYLGGVTFHTSAIEVPQINGDETFYSILKAGQLANIETLTLSGNWTESYFNTLKLALGTNSSLTSIDMSNVTIPTSDFLSGVTNPNCLKYVSQDAEVPSAWTTNVIKGSTAENIVLTDGNAFNNTKEFTAKNISFERDFTVVVNGWASLCLPFAVEVGEGDLVEEFSACSGTKATFTVVETITPNKPCIIKIAEEVGTKTFSASGVTVLATEIKDVCSGEYTFKGNYREIPVGSVTDNMYLLQASGAAFAKGSATSYIPAFRAYIEYTPSGEPNSAKQLTIGHDGGGTTGLNIHETANGLKIWSGNGVIEMISDQAQAIKLYGLDGCTIRTIELKEGANTVAGLAKGIYLINNQKVVVR